MEKKILGVIGGVGPEATFYFCNKIVKMTDAKNDQEHIKMVVLNDTEIPDRTEYILDSTKENPIIKFKENIKILETLNVDYIAIPCNTSGAFYDELQGSTHLKKINMIEETILELKGRNVKKVGVLATTGTIISKNYQRHCENHDIECLIPDTRDQEKVMAIIYDQIKKGNPLVEDDFFYLVDKLKSQDCEAVILGCTELSIIKGMLNLGEYYVDALEVLAKTCILMCDKKLKN